MRIILLALISTICAGAASAKSISVYKWIDENNVVHFSHHHPINDNYTEVKVEVAYQANSTIEEEYPEEEQEQEEIPTPEQLKLAKANEALIKMNCEAAKVNVKILNSLDKILFTDPSGESRIIGPEERAEQLVQTEKHLEIYCNEQ